MKTLAILGRQPIVGIAELESLLGADKITPLQGGGVLIDVAAEDIPFSRLGGAVKLGTILTTLETTSWKDIDRFLIPATKEHAEDVPEGKLTIGLSVYGVDVSRQELERTALSIKKEIKSSGRPVRIVPNKSPEISTPQIIHNKLTGPNGWELVFYRNGNSTIIAQTTDIQDIESYTARDQARPMRDARVGMLPPKLAQTIINLASGKNTIASVLDPFCGTGVVLQEAILMGFSAYGTDIEPRMIEYTNANIAWLEKEFRLHDARYQATLGDATNYKWKKQFDTVACEGYLGLPFAHMPSPDHLQESIQVSNTVAKGFLKNLASQVEKGFRLCIGLPAWHLPNSVKHLPCLDELQKLGWQRVRFEHAHPADLIYRREDQVVGRELVVLTKI
jgi:tRNA (guanine10-N2)-dimethyltransferase